MGYNDYNRIFHEYLDFTDRDTRRALVGLEEADQNQLLAALTSKLYDKIVEKVDDIDFGTIPRSRGDITKIENYASLMECIEILRTLINEYKEDTYPIDVVSTAVENVKMRKKMFAKAFTVNVEMPIILYNTTVLAIVSSVSYLISGCVEYIKDPATESYAIALDRVGYNKTAHNLLFENLASFNAACKNGDLDFAMDEVIKNNRKLAAECGGSEWGDTPVVDPEDPVDGVPCAVPPCDDNIWGDEPMECEPPCDKIPPVDHDVPPMHCKPMPPHVVHFARSMPPKPECPHDFEREILHDIDSDLDNENKPVEEGIVGAIKTGVGLAFSAIPIASRAILTLVKCVVPFIQNLVYFYYNTKQKVSDYCAIQSELVQMNAYKVQYNANIDTASRKNIYAKQMKIADRLKRISNTFSIDYNKSKKAAEDMKAKDKADVYKASDLGYSAPVMATSDSLLF